MRAQRLLAGLLLAVVAGAMAHAEPTAWEMDTSASRLTFTPRLAGGEFTSRFERFDVALRLDTADLPNSSLQVTVDLLSARTGDTDRDATLQGADFFATARWPKARFVSNAIRGLGGNRYEARGKLTLRDVTLDVVVPFRFEQEASTGGKARMTGATTVRRLPFGVGQGEWRSTDWLDDSVRVEFTLALAAPR